MAADNPFVTLMDREKIWGYDVRDVEELRSNPRRISADLLRIFLGSKKAITLWGPVGARKTRTIQAMAGEKDANGVPFQVITIQPSTEDPTIIHGIRYTKPHPDGEVTMERSVPDIAKQVVEFHEETGGYTVMLLDEMTTCMPAQQHALLGFLTHGKFGEYDISPYIAIVMAANPPGTVMTVNDLDIQVMNRGAHIEWYGDVDIFLDEWGSGFGDPDRAPSKYSKWFTENLLETSRHNAFRSSSGNWKPGHLVPQEMIEHSERTTTDLAEVVDNIYALFSGNPVARKFYTIEATRALQGNKWAERANIVLQNEEDIVTASDFIGLVRDAGITPEMSTDEVRGKLKSSLFVSDEGAAYRTDQIISVAEDLVKYIDRSKDKVINTDAMITLWSMATTSPSERMTTNLHQYVIKMVLASNVAYRNGKVEKMYVSPSFVPDDIRQSIRSSLRK